GGPFASIEFGPDGRLYAVTLGGLINTWEVSPSGALVNKTTIALPALAGRAIIGIAFDPASTAEEPIMWISHNLPPNDGLHFTGEIARLTGTNPGQPDEAWQIEPVVVGLPRSVDNHLTNSVRFGPDGALYVSQGSINAMGAPDGFWGGEPETLLSAAILRVDVESLLASDDLPLDVATGYPGPGNNLAPEDNFGFGAPELADLYDPQAPDALLTLHASGIRNAYDLVWHTNGELYVPTNGSAPGGNTPGTPGELPIQCDNRLDGVYTGGPVPGLISVSERQADFLYRIEPNGYYGHPNPTRCEWVLYGGNPSRAKDDIEVGDYPVGVEVDPNFRGYAYNFGISASPNGSIEYRSNNFDSALRGALLVTRFSIPDDIIVLYPGGPDSDIVAADENVPGLTFFGNPLDIAEDLRTGNLYVLEYATVIRLVTANDPGTPEIGTPTDFTLGAVEGQTGSGQLIVRNVGTQPLTITAAVVISGPFMVDDSGLPLVIEPQEAAGLPVIFTAPPETLTTTVPGTLTITSSDPNQPSVEVPLNGVVLTNLVENGSFEDPLDGIWTLTGERDGAISHPEAHNGSRLMLFRPDNNVEYITQTVNTTGTSGEEISATATVAGQALPAGGAVGIRVGLYAAGLEVQRAECVLSDRGTFTWQPLSCTLMAETTYDQITLSIGWAGFNSGLLGIDSGTIGQFTP
ncbi:MAG: hypothetical protein ACFB51_05215, partial [Anaerolineae bacterium]